jgi:predicted RNA-binding Zn ribbon-like protein
MVSARQFEFIGGHPALDFTNTVAWETAGSVNDRLRAFTDVVAWGAACRVVSAAEATALRSRAAREPVRAGEALGHATAVRRLLHDVFGALAVGRTPSEVQRTAFANAVREAAQHLDIVWHRGRAVWRVDEHALTLVVHRVLWVAAALVASNDAARVGICGNPECGWLYLDATKNHSRRWCSMSDCGARDKARRYYRRVTRARRQRRQRGKRS